MKSFSNWTQEEVTDEFGLHLSQEFPLLDEWLAVPTEVSSQDESTLQELSKKLRSRIHHWNEEELKIYFIGLLLNMVDFDMEGCRPFLERDLSVKYAEGKTLSGTVDFFVAGGVQTPKQPFFFIKEYKKERDTSKDPLGQLLAEMVAAQFLNAAKQPVYGAYIVGRYWYFVVLEGNVYTESLSYDATKKDIFEIYNILCKTKSMIRQLVRG